MRRHRIAVTVLATAAAFVLPASASADTRSKSATIAAHAAIATVKARCPRGQRATGGGFTVPPATSTTSIFVYESRKVGQRAWQISAQERTTDAPAPTVKVTAFVYCRADAPRTKQKSSSATSTSTGFAFLSADAKCSSGRARAGGYLLPPPVGDRIADNLAINSLRAGSKTWHVRAGTLVAGIKLTTYVYCASGRRPPQRSGSASIGGDVPAFTATSATCKKEPLAGGFSEPDAVLNLVDGQANSFFRPYEFVRAGKAWRVSGSHVGAASTTLTAIAYCR